MRLRAGDVLGLEALVEIDGRVDAAHDLGRAAGETAAPLLVRRALARLRCAAHPAARVQWKAAMVRSGRALLVALLVALPGLGASALADADAAGQAQLRRVHPGLAAAARACGRLHRRRRENPQSSPISRASSSSSISGRPGARRAARKCRRSSGCKPGSAIRLRSSRYPRIAAAARPLRRSSPSSGSKWSRLYLDPESAVGHAFKVDGLPTSFLIDRQGRVLGRVEGEAEWDSPKMLAIIDPLLTEDEVIKTSFPRARP